MRVLLTRTQTASRKTADRLRALGHEAVLLPLAEAIHHDDDALEALSKPHAALAVTSREALRSLTSQSEALRPHLETPLFAVGAATADAARGLGFRNVTSAEGDGAALARAIANARVDWTDPLLYLAGRPRKQSLEQGLGRSSIPFDVVEAYRMQEMVYKPEEIIIRLDGKAVDAVLLYSAETARRFFALPLSEEIANLFASAHIFCLSADIAENVAKPFRNKVSVAPHPHEEALLSLL
ncbi:uroporphyrinogen-III synthase [Agrobacterium vitis]|uniref:Uroporphyrinogen-III synthase n=1 Tax=Agrobacterium vitis TaxID=373 RepID=A0AAE5AWD1_AGRVI|nr:uroporphyrinogen-III synthase [Agrobacterium vitis]MCF1498125.1 uroporphyrinogen-III synthase [Allorhizobium sp. Av2]MCM2440250.1 uroporphyrinogen-III synthase [Agrobacterium vitis]MUZ58045.1 uroporphyrinogen-III synthase [Agrobacterium vitis]MVA66007.1 uroporphyrinogen-III synthase [Agrobacterium vitis]MVA86925.1 uroporphyrinogen-III synthase [Agrobacterium vitis]